MMLRHKILGMLLLGLATGTLGACQDPVDGGSADPALEDIDADQIVFGMVSFLTASGVREGRIHADTAYAYQDSSRVDLRGLELELYDDNGRPRATVTSETGEMDSRTDAMVARGNVVLILHADRRRIESPELHYDPARDRIWSDSATVQRMADGQVTRGSAFESDLQFRNMRIANPRGAITGVVF